jgi:L-aspartate oxidase
MSFDFIIVGSGLAGLTSALVLKDFGKVLLVTKGKLVDCATDLAQGGIAAAVDKGDSFESHIKDTLIAGAYHNDREAVEYLVKNAPKAIDWLVSQGVKFDSENGRFLQTREAAHSFPRVLHNGDFTGREIEKVLVKRVLESDKITVWENCFVSDLIIDKKICLGIRCHCEGVPSGTPEAIPSGNSEFQRFHRERDRHAPITSGIVMTEVFSKYTILATGGLGQLYQWTTNPVVATGDGIALAYRVGAKISDMEFIQFHPTALKYGKSPLFLLSEALRGEGGHLVKLKTKSLKLKADKDGERFMKDYDSRMELAPRDIVARAIYHEQQKGFDVYLDIRYKGEAFLKKRFPNIHKKLQSYGLNLARDLIPVTPAAHYSCGGVKTDLYGRTSVKNLFAFGEVACTGVHGANRLASNSLLEAVVFPLRLRVQMSSRVPMKSGRGDPLIQQNNVLLTDLYTDHQGIASSPSTSLRTPRNDIKTQLQKLMWGKAGIVRVRQGLLEAQEKIVKWEKEMNGFKETNRKISETKNMLLVAKLIVESSLKRKKSLGSHFIVKN